MAEDAKIREQIQKMENRVKMMKMNADGLNKIVIEQEKKDAYNSKDGSNLLTNVSNA